MRSGVERRLTLSAAAMVALVGCAHADSAADRHVEEMREAIGKVQSDQDRTNQRLDMLEGMVDEKKTAQPSPDQRPRAAPPAARTVQIGDADDSRESDDPNDPNARPEIKVQGPPGAASRPVRGKAGRGRNELRAEPADEALRPDTTRAPALDPEAKKSYEAALALVNSKQYDRALEALSAFLVRWPDHPYAENATYWRGECYFARGEYLRAAEQFEGVLTRFGGGNKAPDALLKIGMSHERLGSTDRAKEYWDRLRRDFPRSEAAKKIPGDARNEIRGAPSTSAPGPKENR